MIGTATPLPGNVALYGTVEGRFSFLQVTAEFAQSLLPPHLELAPQSYCPPGFHPLLLMFNKTQLQSNSTLERIAQEYKLGLNLNYNEFIVMLPYVQFTNSEYNEGAPYCYLPVLYLDSILAVLGGRIFWEFNKILAKFDVEGFNFNVYDEMNGTTLFTTQFAAEGAPVLDSQVPNFETIAPILRLPVIEHGPYGYVSSVYTVGYENEMITPGDMQLNNNSCRFMPSGLLSSPSINQSPMGCFNLTYNWTLTYIKFVKF
jgi:Acetoacetate decarboxylase (ADC)